MRISIILTLLAGQLACIRPSDDYPVHIHGQGTELGAVMPSPEPRSGRIEIARFRLWGSNLGLGLTALFGDAPRSDGLDFVLANGEFGYPADPNFDRSSTFVNAGPPVDDTEDRCFSRAYTGDFVGIGEYVDVGDHVGLTAPDGATIRLERDPSSYPDPAGESFYVGYGQQIKPAITGHETLPDTWRPNENWALSAPGGIPPADATVGSIPFPWQGGTLTTPPAMVGLRINGELVRPPRHGYDAGGRWVSEDLEDTVRFAGPWSGDVELTWDQAPSPSPVTLTIRYLSNAVEGTCGCVADCSAGFTCTAEGQCVSKEGVTGQPRGELTCTLLDDGAFTLTADHLAELDRWVKPADRDGAILMMSRITEGTVNVPAVRTHNDKRVEMAPVRTRAIDTVITRLEVR